MGHVRFSNELIKMKSQISISRAEQYFTIYEQDREQDEDECEKRENSAGPRSSSNAIESAKYDKSVCMA